MTSGAAIAEDQVSKVDYQDTTDLAQATEDMAIRSTGSGNIANSIYASPVDQPGSIALAALLAHAERGVSLIAGPAAMIDGPSSLSHYLRMWGSETLSLTVVGTGLGATQSSAAAGPTTVQRAVLPVARVTGLTPGATSWTLTYTSVAGAATYAAYDLFGTQVATSASTSMTIPNPQTSISLVASDGSGNQLSNLSYFFNNYDDSTTLESAVIGSAAGGTNYLQFLGTLKTPRVITRTTSDPFSMEGTTVTDIVAITCLPYFVDRGLDATKQYEYQIQTMTPQANRACDPLASLNPASTGQIQAAKVAVPPTEFPPVATALKKGLRTSSASLSRVKATHAAMPTISDAQLMIATGETTARSRMVAAALSAPVTESRAANGNTTSELPTYIMRYTGFIPECLVAVPGYPTFDITHPQLAVKGDCRANIPDPAASYRFRLDIQMNFGLQQVSISRSMGESESFHCTVFFNSCNSIEKKTAPIAQMQLVSSSINGDSATAHVNVSATIPVVFGAPAIDADMTFHLAPGNSYVRGWHDRMPVHDMFDGVAQSEFYTLYHSGSHDVSCLFDTPSLTLPGCRVNVNIHN